MRRQQKGYRWMTVGGLSNTPSMPDWAPEQTNPPNGYITEDATKFYVAEDGKTFYVQES
jgi:hypothetical protein